MSMRFFIIYASFSIVLAVIVAFVSGPLWGLPLDYEKGQHLQLIQIAIPPFVAYLTAAIAYAKSRNSFPEPRGERGRILRIVCLGGIVIFALGFAIATYVFYETGNASGCQRIQRDTLNSGNPLFPPRRAR